MTPKVVEVVVVEVKQEVTNVQEEADAKGAIGEAKKATMDAVVRGMTNGQNMKVVGEEAKMVEIPEEEDQPIDAQ